MKPKSGRHHPWIQVCILVLAIYSCRKNELINQEQPTQLTTTRIVSGVVPDDPQRVAKVPLIVSSSFLRLQNQMLLRTGTGKGNSGSTDVTPPTITITSPADGASIAGTINIAVNATDNVKVTSVSYTVDGNAIGSSATAPFTISWNTESLAGGLHTLTANAFDAAGNSSFNSIFVSKNTSVVNPPASTGVSLSMPPVQDQGGEASCAAFVVGYATRSSEYYYRTNAASYSFATNVFSPEYLYDQVKFSSDCSSGTSMTAALDFIVNNGICIWQTMPYSSTNGCSLMPTTAQIAEAANYKIPVYSKIINSDQAAIKAMIDQKHPVIANVTCDNSFINASAGFIWKTYSGSGSLPHCITICGYDDTKHAYKIMNSWGTSWGDAGYSWIDYDFFPTRAGYYLYVMN